MNKIEFADNLRVCTIKHLKGIEVEEEYKKVVDRFIYYMGAYCAELKYTEGEILHNDKLYASVFRLFNSVILKRDFDLEFNQKLEKV